MLEDKLLLTLRVKKFKSSSTPFASKICHNWMSILLQFSRLSIIIGKFSCGLILQLKWQEIWIWVFQTLGSSISWSGQLRWLLLLIRWTFPKILDHSIPAETLMLELNFGRVNKNFNRNCKCVVLNGSCQHDLSASIIHLSSKSILFVKSYWYTIWFELMSLLICLL